MSVTSAASPSLCNILDGIQASLEDTLESLSEPEFRLDLSGVERITSEEINDLIAFQAVLRHQRCKLVLENVSSQLKQVFRLTRLDRLFEVRF